MIFKHFHLCTVSRAYIIQPAPVTFGVFQIQFSDIIFGRKKVNIYNVPVMNQFQQIFFRVCEPGIDLKGFKRGLIFKNIIII